MRAVPSTCGMILSRKFGARAEDLRILSCVECAMLEAHRRHRDRDRTVLQHAEQRVLLDAAASATASFFGNPHSSRPPAIGASSSRIHRVHVAAGLAAEAHGDHLAAFGVVAEAGRVRHADEFELDDRIGHLERRGNHRAQRVRIGPVRDDEELAIDEPVRPGRKRRAGQRHRVGALRLTSSSVIAIVLATAGFRRARS